jgi:hypothetical protein
MKISQEITGVFGGLRLRTHSLSGFLTGEKKS